VTTDRTGSSSPRDATINPSITAVPTVPTVAAAGPEPSDPEPEASSRPVPARSATEVMPARSTTLTGSSNAYDSEFA
jgi:hypothetical protein